MRSKKLATSLLFFLWAAFSMHAAHAVDIGTCRAQTEKQAKHLFFSLEEGKRLLLEIQTLKHADALLAKERSLLALSKEREKLYRDRLSFCEKAKEGLVDAKKKAEALISLLKKERSRIIQEVAKLTEENLALKRSRVTLGMIGLGSGMLAVGAANLVAGLGYAQGDARTLLVAIGISAGVAGAGLILLAVVR